MQNTNTTPANLDELYKEWDTAFAAKDVKLANQFEARLKVEVRKSKDPRGKQLLNSLSCARASYIRRFAKDRMSEIIQSGPMGRNPYRQPAADSDEDVEE